ncbi:FAD binding domain-containing protein [Haloarchaeobius salinus]|uniref:FAD binding domain-containing protein n=1 Tax=Haloarchaeobius salinus TaxID=1198298 RepID=UPI002108D4C8|nr:FAD binding domain-containing protein [Haloarchaeobius salinus]
MKPAQFQYHRPTSAAEAVELAAELEEAEFMAGNQSLGIVMSNRLATPANIVDLSRVDELDFVEVDEDTVRVGALTTHRSISQSDALAEHVPMLPAAAEQIAGPSVRNRGTLGGSLGEADPAGNYPAALVALDGDITLRGPDGTRTTSARDFFIAYMFTDMTEAELIESVSVPREPFPPDRTGMAFDELKRAAQTWPTISAGASVRVDDPDADEPTIEDARLALANAADVPLHVPDAEAAVEGEPLSEATLDEVGAAAREAADPSEEMHADREFKLDVAAEYSRRALETAYGRACGTGGGAA